MSDSRAESRGVLGGWATSRSDALADTYRGRAASRVRAVSGARYHALAEADGVGISVSGLRRVTRTNVYAESRAARFGRGHSRAVMIRVRR